MDEKSSHKVLIGFKCSPLLRASLCSQSAQLGVTLSSFVETLVLSQVHAIAAKDKTIKELENRLKEERAITHTTVSTFIMQISEGKQTKATQLINNYNQILNNEKSNSNR